MTKKDVWENIGKWLILIPSESPISWLPKIREVLWIIALGETGAVCGYFSPRWKSLGLRLFRVFCF